MTPQALTEMIKTIAANYRYTYKDCSEDVMQRMLVSWYEALIEYTDEQVQSAFRMCLRKCKTPPSIADVVERIEKAMDLKRPSKSEIWEQLMSAVRETQKYVYVKEGGMRPMYKLKNKECKDIFASLPASVKKWVGFDTFCSYAEMSATALGVERARFMKEIDDIRETIREVRQISVMEHLLISGQVPKIGD